MAEQQSGLNSEIKTETDKNGNSVLVFQPSDLQIITDSNIYRQKVQSLRDGGFNLVPFEKDNIKGYIAQRYVNNLHHKVIFGMSTKKA